MAKNREKFFINLGKRYEIKSKKKNIIYKLLYLLHSSIIKNMKMTTMKNCSFRLYQHLHYPPLWSLNQAWFIPKCLLIEESNSVDPHPSTRKRKHELEWDRSISMRSFSFSIKRSHVSNRESQKKFINHS